MASVGNSVTGQRRFECRVCTTPGPPWSGDSDYHGPATATVCVRLNQVNWPHRQSSRTEALRRLVLRLAEKHGHHKADDSHQSPEQALTNYIQDRVRSGAFRSLDPELVTRLFIQTIMMFAADQELHLFGPPLPQSDDAAVKTLVSMFLDGMKA